MSGIYHINKGVNKPIMFRGLKAQYIAYLAAGLLLLLLIFAVGYLAGITVYLLAPAVVMLGAVLFWGVYHLSRKFGEHGLMKFFARRNIPAYLKFRSRKLFTQLKHRNYDGSR